VGEIGLGTLYPFLAGGKPFFVGVTVQDEKMGAHVGIGNSLKEHTGANWESDVHADGLLKNCTIKVDGRTIMRNGVYARWLTRGLIAA
jgi:leucyl aminopeptidase (aminopeptidase T)